MPRCWGAEDALSFSRSGKYPRDFHPASINDLGIWARELTASTEHALEVPSLLPSFSARVAVGVDANGRWSVAAVPTLPAAIAGWYLGARSLSQGAGWPSSRDGLQRLAALDAESSELSTSASEAAVLRIAEECVAEAFPQRAAIPKRRARFIAHIAAALLARALGEVSADCLIDAAVTAFVNRPADPALFAGIDSELAPTDVVAAIEVPVRRALQLDLGKRRLSQMWNAGRPSYDVAALAIGSGAGPVAFVGRGPHPSRQQLAATIEGTAFKSALHDTPIVLAASELRTTTRSWGPRSSTRLAVDEAMQNPASADSALLLCDQLLDQLRAPDLGVVSGRRSATFAECVSERMATASTLQERSDLLILTMASAHHFVTIDWAEAPDQIDSARLWREVVDLVRIATEADPDLLAAVCADQQCWHPSFAQSGQYATNQMYLGARYGSRWLTYLPATLAAPHPVADPTNALFFPAHAAADIALHSLNTFHAGSRAGGRRTGATTELRRLKSTTRFAEDRLLVAQHESLLDLQLSLDTRRRVLEDVEVALILATGTDDSGPLLELLEQTVAELVSLSKVIDDRTDTLSAVMARKVARALPLASEIQDACACGDPAALVVPTDRVAGVTVLFGNRIKRALQERMRIGAHRTAQLVARAPLRSSIAY